MGAGLRDARRAATVLAPVVEDPKLRATLAGSRGLGAELVFRYLGPTEITTPLRSGSERRQLGLELIARDTCDLLYVMWRLEPESKLVVSIKQNEGQRSHAQCENRGYRRLQPTFAAPVPRLSPGARYSLRAELEGGVLHVHVDAERVGEGPVNTAGLAARLS